MVYNVNRKAVKGSGHNNVHALQSPSLHEQAAQPEEQAVDPPLDDAPQMDNAQEHQRAEKYQIQKILQLEEEQQIHHDQQQRQEKHSEEKGNQSEVEDHVFVEEPTPLTTTTNSTTTPKTIQSVPPSIQWDHGHDTVHEPDSAAGVGNNAIPFVITVVENVT